jgi:hypothetical protein
MIFMTHLFDIVHCPSFYLNPECFGNPTGLETSFIQGPNRAGFFQALEPIS